MQNEPGNYPFIEQFVNLPRRWLHAVAWLFGTLILITLTNWNVMHDGCSVIITITRGPSATVSGATSYPPGGPSEPLFYILRWSFFPINISLNSSFIRQSINYYQSLIPWYYSRKSSSKDTFALYFIIYQWLLKICK